MKRVMLLAACVLAIVASVSAQGKPAFVGKWKDVMSSARQTITVEGNKMTVTVTLAGNSASSVYMLDGTPSTNTIKGPGNKPIDQIYTSKWDGDVLVTTITTPGPAPMVDRRWIDADGTMKVERSVVIQGKPDSNTQTFKRLE